MEVFNGDRLFEERAFSALNWAYFTKGTIAKEARLKPLINVYKDSERIKMIYYQEAEDNYEEALRIMNDFEEDYDQYIICYEGQMMLDDTQEPQNTLMVKAFDRRMEKGVFIIQKYKLIADSIIGITRLGNPQVIDLIPMSMGRLPAKDEVAEYDAVRSNIIAVKGELNKIDLHVLIRHHSESEIYSHILDGTETKLKNFDEENLSGIFRFNVNRNEKINRNVLSFLVKDAFQTLFSSSFVSDNFTKKMRSLTFIAEYGDIEIANESTNDVIDEIRELYKIMGAVSPESRKTETKNKWWEFWK